ncbi:SDR family oxidoreductase [Flavobacterium salilacus subsp. salilacus]|uniref:SDR family oxidoreductase n=1 Tax=Flavobacterium TaxID=237 RepID=UPI0010754580|nr:MULTISPECIES: SDR family oxidoreductase [Flavobacterium]KAF2518956.1 SDR family oxidoreductase [Flavobacterium salilacus subsp. salilacus]MBE1614882.1 SDR family oxidoreductase [Flavobacterium sp. SaA2.13]
MSTILVTGATGSLGGTTVDFLLKRTDAPNILVLVRDAAKAADLKSKGVTLLEGDYNDYASLVKAFKGIDKLYFVSSSDIENRNSQHKNVVDAAKEAGVKHVLYTSFVRKNETETSPIASIAESHLKTEQWLEASGVNYTILKHTIYTDMIPVFLGDKLLETGIAYLPAGNGKVAFASRNDMAEVASVLLTTGGHENKVYDITNETAVTFQDITNVITKITSKEITYVSPSSEEYIDTLTKAGVPAGYIHMFAGFAEAFKQNEFDAVNNKIETILGRKPETVAEYLKGVYGN